MEKSNYYKKWHQEAGKGDMIPGKPQQERGVRITSIKKIFTCGSKHMEQITKILM